MQYFRILKIVGDRHPFLVEGNVYTQEDLDKFAGSTPLKLKRVQVNNAYPSDGTEETGENIIEALEYLGGVNDRGFRGTSKLIYYINEDGYIRMSYAPLEGMILNQHLKKLIDMKKLSMQELAFTTILIVSILSTLGLIGSIVLWILWGWSMAWRSGLTSIVAFVLTCFVVATFYASGQKVKTLKKK